MQILSTIKSLDSDASCSVIAHHFDGKKVKILKTDRKPPIHNPMGRDCTGLIGTVLQTELINTCHNESWIDHWVEFEDGYRSTFRADRVEIQN